MSKKLPPEALASVVTNDNPSRLADTIAAHLFTKNEDKQRVLSLASCPRTGSKLVIEIIGREMELMELEKRINVRVRKQIEKSQKEYYLREQIKAIQKELGDRDEKGTESDEFRDKSAEARASKGTTRKRPCARSSGSRRCRPWSLRPSSCGITWNGSALLPWNLSTPKTASNIAEAEAILDEDHYGLVKVKEAHRRVPLDTPARQAYAGSDPVLCRTSRSRQDVARQVDRPCARPEIRAHLARRRARRGRDPRAQAHIRRRTAGAHCPGDEDRRFEEPGLPHGRDRQDELRTSAAIRRRRCWRCSIRSRIIRSPITISRCRSTSRM